MPVSESNDENRESNYVEPDEARPDILRIPKNRSTGNLLANPEKSPENARIRFSFDAGSKGKGSDPGRMSPVAMDHELGMGASGLRRIRQLPPSKAPSQSSSPSASFSVPPRASSMTFGINTPRTWTEAGGPSSPTMNLNEDLSRFPSESLHSFSFAQLSEDVLQNRQNILKRSIDFLMDKLGWAANHPGLVNAQAKVSGDSEIQSMVELLSRANVLSIDTAGTRKSRFLNGPLTGPAITNGSNVFDKAFDARSQSEERIQREKTLQEIDLPKENVDPSRPSSGHPELSLSSDESAPEYSEPRSPTEISSVSGDSPFVKKRTVHKRTFTDLSMLTLHTKLFEALARPYPANEGPHADHPLSPTPVSAFRKPTNSNAHIPGAVHGHPNRFAPPTQAIFTTENIAPWTILAANDLACLVIGVTKGEVRKLSILEVVQGNKRAWLEKRLKSVTSDETTQTPSSSNKSSRSSTETKSTLAMGNGVTAQLLSKPSSRELAKQRAKGGETVNGPKSGGARTKSAHKGAHGVLLCGDVVPIQKRNGATASASLWVKEKQGGLIWVLEEINEDTATLCLDAESRIASSSGALGVIFGESTITPETGIQKLIPQIPIASSSVNRKVDYEQVIEAQYYAARNAEDTCIPISVFAGQDRRSLHITSFPHIAGIMVLKADTLDITSSNSAFSAALFGISDPDGLNITSLIPHFDKLLEVLADEDEVTFTDGMVIPEHTFRKARDLLTLRDVNANPASVFLKPPGLAARHRDGSSINVDVQMRIVRSEKTELDEAVIEEVDEDASDAQKPRGSAATTSELVFALWITYSRQLHSTYHARGSASPIVSKPVTPLPPSPGQTGPVSPQSADSDDNRSDTSRTSSVTRQIQEATSLPISDSTPKPSAIMTKPPAAPLKVEEVSLKKKIADFAILEDMGQGAYGQVKLARYNKTGKKVVLKYVTKKRILVDTWTRDRRLGTVPLEIHVLDYLRKDGLKHPNIVEMIGFFEDNINYYIEMVPHGLPGMDLFDYIEMRSTMDEVECRSIFLQVVAALHHLHTKALVVHRDIKDENIILDGENKVKLIDFGSAAYIKNGPFDVFVGTIDYAAPEVLQGKSYRGKEQDVWALGILLYTLVYKENPFYSIDEIMDHELRIPWIMSEPSIDLIKAMLNRDVDQRLTITQVMEHPWCKGKGDEGREHEG